MSFTPPVFNLICNIWRNGNPTSNPPDVVSQCNLALGKRIGQVQSLVMTGMLYPGSMWLLLPAGTDIRDSISVAGGDTVEVGAGTGRFYFVVWVDDAGGGFSNEHRFAEILNLGGWPEPYPSPTGGGPPPPPDDPWDLFGYLSNSSATTSLSQSFAWTKTKRLVVVLYVYPGPGGLQLTNNVGGPTNHLFEDTGPTVMGLTSYLAVFDVSSVLTIATHTLTTGTNDLIVITGAQTNTPNFDVGGGGSGTSAPILAAMVSGAHDNLAPVLGLMADSQSGFSNIVWQLPFPVASSLGDLFDMDSMGNPWAFSMNKATYPAGGNPTLTLTDVGAAVTSWLSHLISMRA